MHASSMQPDHLRRAIGRWSLAALMLNTMIGGSAFGLPSLLVARLGKWSTLAYCVAAVGVGSIAATLAEVSSQFRASGGVYLYARAAFGRFVGIQIGWLMWLSRIAACSAIANLFISYMAQFVPAVAFGLVRAVLLVAFISFLAIVNYLGVAKGTLLNNCFAATKLIVLMLFIVAGLAAPLIYPAIRVTPDTVSSHAADWFEALILIVYAYGGFESALFPSGEARDPRKDAPIALCVAVVTATFLYVGLQYVVIHILPHAAATSTPAADVAKRLVGSLGGSLLTAGILVSLYGSLSANMLETPRLTFAMGEQGDFPKFFAAIHPRFRSPHLSIAAFALLLTAFSIGGTFRGNAILSAGSRLFVYATTAAALPVLRRKHPSADAFRLPFGIAFSVLALVFTGLLVARIQIRDLIVIAAAFTVGALNWLWARRIPSAPSVLAANGVESGL
jgi:basic amino acid/polyamine antiporter, APA family